MRTVRRMASRSNFPAESSGASVPSKMTRVDWVRLCDEAAIAREPAHQKRTLQACARFDEYAKAGGGPYTAIERRLDTIGRVPPLPEFPGGTS